MRAKERDLCPLCHGRVLVWQSNGLWYAICNCPCSLAAGPSDSVALDRWVVWRVAQQLEGA